MKIHNRHAETLLFEKVRSLTHEPHDNWRCIYIRLSSRQERYNQSVRNYFIIDAIRSMLNDIEGHIYICGDGDIFLLFQGALHPVFNRLSSHFADLTPASLTTQREDGLFNVFDLGRQWLQFTHLCEGKHYGMISALEKRQASFAHYERAYPSPSV